MSDIRALPRIASIATLASRRETFAQVLPVIAAQVDHVFVHLDGYGEVPALLSAHANVTVRRAPIHCSSRYLPLRDLPGPAVFMSVDDDIRYPPNYAEVMAEVLHRLGGAAMIGVHGRTYLPPHGSYVRHCNVIHFAAPMKAMRHVHELGTGTAAFVTDRLSFDPTRWERHDMDDINVAIEAQLRGLPRIAIPRAAGWLTALAEEQPDSIWNRTIADDSAHSRRMRELLALYAPVPVTPAPVPPATRSRGVHPPVPTPE